MKNVSRNSEAAGFSLVETIAAMGILALAAIPLLQLVNNSIRNSASLEQRFLARSVAENILVERIAQAAQPTDEAVVETGRSQQFGRQFDWTVTTLPVQELAPQFVKVDVRLAENPQLLSSLSGVRLPEMPSLPQLRGGDTGGEQIETEEGREDEQ